MSKPLIEIHYDHTDGNEVSYQEGLHLARLMLPFSTCCLEFVCSDYLKTHSVIILNKRGSYIDLDELMDNTGIYTDKIITTEHNLRRLLVGGAFHTWVKKPVSENVLSVENTEVSKDTFIWPALMTVDDNLVNIKFRDFPEIDSTTIAGSATEVLRLATQLLSAAINYRIEKNEVFNISRSLEQNEGYIGIDEETTKVIINYLKKG